MFDFIIWNADPEIVKIGFLQLRWYGLLFALGFIISQQFLYFIYKKEGKNPEDIDTLTVYMVIATIIGARLGHVFFYEPEKYLADPFEILMIQKGGLASHGAAIGILLALWIYSRYSIKIGWFKFEKKKIQRPGQSYLQVLDRIVIFVAMTAALIRLGNFVNSEIEGKPSGTETGVFFARNINDVMLSMKEQAIMDVSFAKSSHEVDSAGLGPVKIFLTIDGNNQEENVRGYIENNVAFQLRSNPAIQKHLYEPVVGPLDYEVYKDGDSWKAVINSQAVIRYPTQLIESSGYLLVFLFLLLIWYRYKEQLPEGRIFGWFMVTLWSFRFGFEFFKANQVDFENNLPLNMGQLLSIPLIIIGLIILIRSYRLSPDNTE